MKLEAVDKRNPALIRVATVVETEDHRIKVIYILFFYLLILKQEHLLPAEQL